MAESGIRLIVNADDLGLSAAIDEGIFQAAAQGLGTSVSVLPGGPDFARAAARLARLPRAPGAGVHLALSGGLRPVSPPDQVRTLLVDGRMRSDWKTFVRDFWAGRIRSEEIARELSAQAERAFAAGLTLDHVDGHQHLHVLPGVLPHVLRLCERFCVGAMRVPAETFAGAGRELERGLLATLSRGARRRLPAWMKTPDEFHGLVVGGALDLPALLGILERLGPGTHELACHPGARDESVPEDPAWRYRWTAELGALTSPEARERVERRGISLIRFSEL